MKPKRPGHTQPPNANSERISPADDCRPVRLSATLSAVNTESLRAAGGIESQDVRASASPVEQTRVAVVEDDAGLRRGIECLLANSPGFNCAGACGSGEEALKYIPRWQPDVVLMDIHLPNRSGIECTALLKQQLPQLQVIMLTVYEDTETIFKALRAGACGYLLKRAMPEEILEAIIEVRHGGAPMTSEIARKVLSVFQEPAIAMPDTEDLSRREREILEVLLQGFSNKEIAARLSISVPTVKVHLRHIYEKLHVRCRLDVLLKFRPASLPHLRDEQP
jgi:DNA-binding NarL/FixJ family response regulator